MKNLFIFLVLVFALSSCSNLLTATQAVPTPIKVEVTRIVQITTTPVPTSTLAPTLTLDSVNVSSTQVAEMIGTPIVPSMKCYDTAFTQLDLNSCAMGRRAEMEEQMENLLGLLEKKYENSPKEKFQTILKFQSEWKDFIKRECEFLSGYIMVERNGTLFYEGGSMSVMNYGECLVQKYQDRLRELQAELFPRG